MSKTIYKKTLANVLRHVIKNKRTELKLTARELHISKESAAIALSTLTKFGFIKERKYKDIGVSYYYPSKDRAFTIFVLMPTRSFMFVCDSSMNVKYNLWYGNVPYMDTKMNLHHFVKRMCNYLQSNCAEIPGTIPFLAIPGKVDKVSGRICSPYFPDLTSTDIEKYLCKLINVKRIGIFGYEYSPEQSYKSEDFLLEIMLGATKRFFVKKKKSTHKSASISR